MVSASRIITASAIHHNQLVTLPSSSHHETDGATNGSGVGVGTNTAAAGAADPGLRVGAAGVGVLARNTPGFTGIGAKVGVGVGIDTWPTTTGVGVGVLVGGIPARPAVGLGGVLPISNVGAGTAVGDAESCLVGIEAEVGGGQMPPPE